MSLFFFTDKSMSYYRPFWVVDGDESYDCNSGMSFSVLIYVVDGSGSVFSISTHLCKPQIYGLWHCLWNNESHLSMLNTLGATGVVVIHKDTMELMMLPVKDYYPFSDLLQPHTISSENYTEICEHIDRSVEPFESGIFLQFVLENSVRRADVLFDLLDEVLDPTQKASIKEAWSKKIIEDLIEERDAEYDIF